MSPREPGTYKKKISLRSIRGHILRTKRDIEKFYKELQHATLTDSGAQQLRVLAVQLNWRSTQLCPDMSYQACEVSTKVKYAKIIDTKNANKAIRKLKSSEVTPKFHNLDDLEKPYIECFRDAALANLKNGGS